MEIAKVHISGTRARTVFCKEIPRGIIGAKVALEYDEELWSGLIKKVVFTNGIRTVELVNPGGLATLPPEVVDIVGREVRIGVCGTDADGKLVVPTLWAALSVVRNAVPVESDAASDGTPPAWAQAMAMIGNLDDLDTVARNNLVAAVNELVARGGEIDATEVQRIVDEYLAANMPEADLPEALPNPHPLRLTGAVEATYDGNEPVEVVIPQGVDGIPKGWELVIDAVIEGEEVTSIEFDEDVNGNPLNMKEFYFYVHVPTAVTGSNTYFRFYCCDGVRPAYQAPNVTLNGIGKQSVFEAWGMVSISENEDLLVESVYSRTNIYTGGTGAVYSNNFRANKASCVKRISFSSGMAYPAGTIIKIYKVR